MFKIVTLQFGVVTFGLLGCAYPQKPQPLSITASDPPFSRTVGEYLKDYETLPDFSKNYSLTMLGLIAKNVEITSGIPTKECPHVQGHIIDGPTAHEPLVNGVKQNPQLANEHINAALKKVMPLPECVEGPPDTRSATF